MACEVLQFVTIINLVYLYLIPQVTVLEQWQLHAKVNCKCVTSQLVLRENLEILDNNTQL